MQNLENIPHIGDLVMDRVKDAVLVEGLTLVAAVNHGNSGVLLVLPPRKAAFAKPFTRLAVLSVHFQPEVFTYTINGGRETMVWYDSADKIQAFLDEWEQAVKTGMRNGGTQK